MSKEFVSEDICNLKVSVYLNNAGNIVQNDEIAVSQKIITFNGIASSITAEEAVNTDESPALHNGVSALMWLFTGQDDNFNENFKKTSVEVMEDV